MAATMVTADRARWMGDLVELTTRKHDHSDPEIAALLRANVHCTFDAAAGDLLRVAALTLRQKLVGSVNFAAGGFVGLHLVTPDGNRVDAAAVDDARVPAAQALVAFVNDDIELGATIIGTAVQAHEPDYAEMLLRRSMRVLHNVHSHPGPDWFA